jgi:hypothetical protein
MQHGRAALSLRERNERTAIPAAQRQYSPEDLCLNMPATFPVVKNGKRILYAFTLESPPAWGRLSGRFIRRRTRSKDLRCCDLSSFLGPRAWRSCGR